MEPGNSGEVGGGALRPAQSRPHSATRSRAIGPDRNRRGAGCRNAGLVRILEHPMPLNIPVILGTVRSQRVGPRVAKFLVRTLQERGQAPTLVDPVEFALPLLDKMYKEYPAGQAPPVLEKLAQIIKAADA